MKLVINKCYGGFKLSIKGLKRLAELKGYNPCIYMNYRNEKKFKKVFGDSESFDKYVVIRDLGIEVSNIDDDLMSAYDLDRTDPDLIRVVEELGKEANGMYSDLRIVEIPDDIDWEIYEYDGIESIRDKSSVLD